jgi:ankyrin repeat protein
MANASVLPRERFLHGDAMEEAGASSIAAPSIQTHLPLHVACFFGKIGAAELLLEADASLEATNNEGLTPQQLLTTDWATTELACLVS